MIKKLFKNSKLRSICHTSSLKTELKIKKFTQNYFVRNFHSFISKENQHTCISMSLFIFIDDFDLYRNNDPFLMNMYVILTTLIFKERARRANVFFNYS